MSRNIKEKSALSDELLNLFFLGKVHWLIKKESQHVYHPI